MSVRMMMQGRKPAAGGSWSPSNLTLVGWWDPSDASWGSFSTGSNVAQWDDLSGNGRHLVTSLGTPARDTTINALSAITFADNETLDHDAGSDVLDISPWSYFAVVDLGATADFDRILTSRRSASGAFDYQSPNAIIAYRASNTSGNYSISAFSAGTQGSTVTGSSGVMLVGSRFDGTNLYVGVNGVWSSATAVSAPGNMRYLRCGGLLNNTTGVPPGGNTLNNLVGVMGEHFLANENVTGSEPWDYLANKWGVTI